MSSPLTPYSAQWLLSQSAESTKSADRSAPSSFVSLREDSWTSAAPLPPGRLAPLICAHRCSSVAKTHLFSLRGLRVLCGGSTANKRAIRRRAGAGPRKGGLRKFSGRVGAPLAALWAIDSASGAGHSASGADPSASGAAVDRSGAGEETSGAACNASSADDSASFAAPSAGSPERGAS